MNDLRFVIDASVLVARLRSNEPGYTDTRSFMAIVTDKNGQLIVPSIALAEVAAALARGIGDSEPALMAVNDLQRLSSLKIFPVENELGNFAARVSARYFIRGCDAIYVSLALALDLPLVTLDRQQRERTPPGLTALSPGELLPLLK